jgi:hypothetical protein
MLEYMPLVVKPCLMLASRAGACTNEASFRCSYLGWAPALSTNNRLGWRGMPGTNTLAYCEHSLILAVKCFMTFDLR